MLKLEDVLHRATQYTKENWEHWIELCKKYPRDEYFHEREREAYEELCAVRNCYLAFLDYEDEQKPVDILQWFEEFVPPFDL